MIKEEHSISEIYPSHLGSKKSTKGYICGTKLTMNHTKRFICCHILQIELSNTWTEKLNRPDILYIVCQSWKM